MPDTLLPFFNGARRRPDPVFDRRIATAFRTTILHEVRATFANVETSLPFLLVGQPETVADGGRKGPRIPILLVAIRLTATSEGNYLLRPIFWRPDSGVEFMECQRSVIEADHAMNILTWRASTRSVPRWYKITLKSVVPSFSVLTSSICATCAKPRIIVKIIKRSIPGRSKCRAVLCTRIGRSKTPRTEHFFQNVIS